MIAWRGRAAQAAWPLAAAAAAFPWGGPHLAHKLAFTAVVLVAAAYAWSHPERLLSPGGRRAALCLSLLTLAGAMAMGMLAVANFSNFDWGDIACYLSCFRNAHGWLPGANIISGRPLLAHHSEFWVVPVGWLFRLAPGPIVVQLAQGGCVLSAWLLFRSWARRRFSDPPAAEWIATGFALSPCLLILLLKGFHGVATALPFLVLTATAFHDRRWGRFLASLLALLLAKEIFILTAMALGAVAVAQRRPLKWMAVPVALGLGYGLFLKFGYFPMMLKDAGYYYGNYARDWRAGLERLAAPRSLGYLALLALWSGGLSAFRTPYALLALPPAALNLYLNGAFASPGFHYIVEPAFWAYFAGAAGLAISADANSRADLGRQLASRLACLLLLLPIPLRGLPFYLHHPCESSFRAALARLPASATVSLGVSLEDHLWTLDRWYWIHYGGESWLDYSSEEACLRGEYALLPLAPALTAMFDPTEKANVEACRERLGSDSAYAEIWRDGNLILYRKDGRKHE